MEKRETARNVALAVTEALKQGQFADARQRLDKALGRWPANARLQILKGTLLERTEGDTQAALHFAGLAEYPNIAALAAKRLTRLLPNVAVPADIRAELVRRLSNSFIEPPEKARMLNAMFEQATPEQRDALLDSLGSSGIFKYEWRLAIKRTEAGQFDSALEILECAHREGRISVPAASLLAELYGLASRLPDAIALMTQVLDAHPDQLDCYLGLTALLQKAGDFAQLAKVFEDAVRRWPHNGMLVMRLNRLPLDRQSFETLFGLIANNAEEALDSDQRFRLQFAVLCLQVGRVARAQELFARPFEETALLGHEPLRKALTARTPERWTGGSRLVDDHSAEVQVTRADRPRATIVVMAGMGFSNLPLSLADAIFADHNVSVIYLRDFASRVHLRGVRALGQDESQTIAALKKMVAVMGAPRTIVMGASTAGFSALRYGALLEADSAVSFSVPTDLGFLFRHIKPSFANPEFFAKVMLDREIDLPLDVAPLLSVPRRTKSILFYGADAAGDARQAERLRGYPGVTLRPVKGIDDSFVLSHLIGDGSFDTLLETLIEK